MTVGLTQVMHSIFTTHTFGGEKSWGDTHRYPYKDILFRDKHIYSDRYRAQNHLYKEGEPVRAMEVARQYGLDQYVFAYLGGHEIYYCSNDGFYSPPFGICVSQSLDRDHATKATRYDLSSRYANRNVPDIFYESPYAAREDSVSRIVQDHSGDFRGYWKSSPDSWERKIEFHYLDKVSIFQIDALLWPVMYVAKRDPRIPGQTIFEADAEYERGRRLFLIELDRLDIKVYPFNWDPDDSKSFTRASEFVAEYFHDYQQLPDEEDFAYQFAKYLPGN